MINGIQILIICRIKLHRLPAIICKEKATFIPNCNEVEKRQRKEKNIRVRIWFFGKLIKFI